MIKLAGAWWESGSWWQFAVTLIAGIAVGGMSVWGTLRAANPKRKINWWVESNTSLLSISERPNDGAPLTVHLGSYALQNPRVVELMIANVGSRDITASMFHADQSMRFDFGSVAVCGILARRSEPEGTVLPGFDAEPVRTIGTTSSAGNWLDLQPCLLKQGQSVTVTVLIDGEEQAVKCVSAGLVDVEVVSESPGRRAQAVADAMSGVTFYLGPLALRFGGTSLTGRSPRILR
ncbi:hypothetical protein ACIBQ5_13035 [Streptomyces massasporeus]|uniref:hypothetical protein n=1 Tax=Streptomyces massasporeus TaxID=67324 RepID=UPI00379CEFF3